MPTEIRFVVDDGELVALEKLVAFQKGRYRFSNLHSVSTKKIESNAPPQHTAEAKLTLDSPLELLGLSTKTFKALSRPHKGIGSGKRKGEFAKIVSAPEMSITTIGQLCSKSKTELQLYFDIGPKRIAEIEAVLAQHGFRLADPQLPL